MAYKNRIESTELRILRFLDTRMSLSNKDQKHLFYLRKGFEGEISFDSFTEQHQEKCFILNDLLLTSNNTTFQIDTLIVSDKIYLFEVKNFEGDYYYNSDRLYTKSHSEISNPLHQLNRCKSLLRQLLHTLGFNLPIDASVVFINPDFNLYQAPLDMPIIFPNQISRFLNKRCKTPVKQIKQHQLLADKLISLHIANSPFMQLPSYEISQLRKGITCQNCSSFSISVKGRSCICNECRNAENVQTAVMRNVEEFKLLFPTAKVTTNAIHEWCHVIESKIRIRRILQKNFKQSGVRQWATFE
ncbi:hypothetical protein J2Z40_002645 [Cytobacillus eiseniae]|uniref:NERD domain-containing protein n=1 Tax=Cytobacillus eiseniae TaxID=762947 RepID=A0ABS4RJU8_9BACI|nr:nuclease-related domain-containing protein [Cytobacillus eiseniae]MBP2242072.1 hypothetical protein [Cytobacillus eiseniae]